MKSCNEMTESVFARIGEYENAKRKKKKLAIKTAAYAFCLCIAAGVVFTVHNIGKSKRAFTTEIINSKPRKDSAAETAVSGGTNDSNSESAESNNSDRTTGDSLGYVVIDGVTYIQNFADDGTYTPDRYIGDARNFEGFYRDGAGSDSSISAEMYTVNERDDVIIIKLGNGGSVTLVKSNN